MTVASYTLGRPRVASSRGGDCRAFDITEARNVYGPHHFADTTDCVITNGMLRLTLGATGGAPTFAMAAYRGGGGIENDFYSDTYSDTYTGSLSTGAWFDMGSLVIDSTSVLAGLTGVRMVRCSPEIVTIRLLCPLIGDAFVTLRRGETMCRIQHGRSRHPLVTTTRRILLTGTPAPVGQASMGMVEETAHTTAGLARCVLTIDAATAHASNFSLTTGATTHGRFGAGVGTPGIVNSASSLHYQLGDASRAQIVVGAPA